MLIFTAQILQIYTGRGVSRIYFIKGRFHFQEGGLRISSGQKQAKKNSVPPKTHKGGGARGGLFSSVAKTYYLEFHEIICSLCMNIFLKKSAFSDMKQALKKTNRVCHFFLENFSRKVSHKKIFLSKLFLLDTLYICRQKDIV